MTDSADIVAALQRGELFALDQFYRAHSGQVLGWAIRLGGPYVDAEDVAQEVFTIALRKIGSFRNEAQVSTWLFAITRNVIANARRKAMLRRFVGLGQVPEIPSGEGGADDALHVYRRRRQVQVALERLGAKHREVLVLMDLEGRSAPEVGEMLDIPPGTVYSRLHYARRAFAQVLQREGISLADFESTPNQVSGRVASGGEAP